MFEGSPLEFREEQLVCDNSAEVSRVNLCFCRVHIFFNVPTLNETVNIVVKGTIFFSI